MGIFRIGKIQIECYRALGLNPNTADVIITKERIQHSNNHQGAFDAYGPEFIPKILWDPEWILRDNDHPYNTVDLIGSFPVDTATLHFYLVLRLHMPEDQPDYYNSIISFWRIRQKEYKRLIKNRAHY